MKDIYFEGKIYPNVDTSVYYPARPTMMQHFKNLSPSYPVSGSHNWKDGQTVVEWKDYKILYQQRDSENNEWSECSKEWYNLPFSSVNYSRIVAIPLGIIDAAKQKTQLRCTYELCVEKYFGYKMTTQAKEFTVNDNILCDLLCAFHQSLSTPLPSGEAVSSDVVEDALFYLSEMVRTVSRLANHWPDMMNGDDLDRLTQSMAVLKKYSNTDKSQILTPSKDTEASPSIEGRSADEIIEDISNGDTCQPFPACMPHKHKDKEMMYLRMDLVTEAMEIYKHQGEATHPIASPLGDNGYSREQLIKKLQEAYDTIGEEKELKHETWIQSAIKEAISAIQVNTPVMPEMQNIKNLFDEFTSSITPQLLTAQESSKGSDAREPGDGHDEFS